MQAPRWISGSVAKIERDERLDRVAGRLRPVAEQVGEGPAGPALRGDWLGHALHPLLTDLPLGCWLSAGLLDVVGGRRSRAAAQRLVGLGVAFVPATAAAGMADYSTVGDARIQRVGAAHAIGNSVVGGLYLMSWLQRRRGHYARGVLLGLGGGALAWVTGYLGGHMSFGRGSSVELRGMDGSDPLADVGGDALPATALGWSTAQAASVADPGELVGLEEAAELLTVPVEQVRAMAAEGMLTPAAGGDALAFQRSEVLALRLQGG